MKTDSRQRRSDSDWKRWLCKRCNGHGILKSHRQGWLWGGKKPSRRRISIDFQSPISPQFSRSVGVSDSPLPHLPTLYVCDSAMLPYSVNVRPYLCVPMLCPIARHGRCLLRTLYTRSWITDHWTRPVSQTVYFEFGPAATPQLACCYYVLWSHLAQPSIGTFMNFEAFTDFKVDSGISQANLVT